MRVASFLLVGLCCVARFAGAQELSRFGEYEVVDASYHKFVLPGETSIRVLVLGDAGATGIYEVGRQVDLGDLVALSSVALGAQTPGERREVTLKLLRQSGGQRSIVYQSSLGDFLVYPGRYPQLADRDVMVVETVVKSRFGWRDGLTIVTAFAAMALAIDRLSTTF